MLLASAELEGSFFERAVILMIRHDDDGAMGLVLNHPTPMTVCEVLSTSPDAEDAECDIEDVMFRGGPCEGPLFVLHSDPESGQDRVLEGVYLATEREMIEPALAGEVQPARFFAGYAGWGPGQLEMEMGQGSWLIDHADAGRVFSSDETLWQTLMDRRKKGDLLKGFDPKILPHDPKMN